PNLSSKSSHWSSLYLPLLLLTLSSSDENVQYGQAHGIRSIPVPSNWCGDPSHSPNHCHHYHYHRYHSSSKVASAYRSSTADHSSSAYRFCSWASQTVTHPHRLSALAALRGLSSS
ncbi:hypothetical protein BDD12DRAFT_864945, partial [Trichophaea hybrida]